MHTTRVFLHGTLRRKYPDDEEDIPNPDGKSFPSMTERYSSYRGRSSQAPLKLNPTKAYGPDYIPVRILQELAHEIASNLVSIFQRSLYTGKGLEDGQRNCHIQERR